ncbi:MAG: aspartyl/asparaginyl beta-hydroxylase domain-containing protein [Steroidobacteraceae bacterium]
MSIDPREISTVDAGNRQPELQRLVSEAQRATNEGQLAQAAALIRRAQELAPHHPAVLTLSGMHALRSGDFFSARRMLELAAAADEASPMAWLNLAMALRASRDSDAELAALERALRLDPYFVLALLQKATLLERNGKEREAAKFYHAFLANLPPSAQSSPSWKEAVLRAEHAVAAHSAKLEQFLAESLAKVRSQYSSNELKRGNECVDVLTGVKRVYVQQPTFMHFPGLPAIQFYPREQFEWLTALEEATAAIQQELLGLFADSSAAFVPYIEKPDGTPLNQWQELNRSLQWSALFLWRAGEPVTDNLQRCPETAAILAKMPMADVDGHAPTAFFSILKPRTRIPPHTGVSNTRLVVHLPLFVPAGCGFRVGSETREWRPGHAWVFDDTIEHEAWNDSAEPRAILIFDIWNPYLSEPERAIVREATRAVAEFNQGASPFSGAL